MDTSDSECFESADEEFDYDFQYENIKTKQNQCTKTIEPELCKLKLEEQEEDDVVADVKHVPNEALSPSQTALQAVTDIISGCDNKTNTESSIPNNDINKLASNTHPKVNRESENIPTINNNENIDKQNNVDDNWGWGDDGSDWGSEVVKELQTDDSPQSNNEDSGWGDFDADWETPVQTENTCSTKGKEEFSKNDHISDDYGDWESLDKPEEKSKLCENPESSWGGWGSWGVTSILNTATQGVSTLTSHVSQGLSAVLETGMGIPEPEELAKMHVPGRENTLNENDSADSPSTPVAFGLGNLVTGVSHLTKFVETTGNKVITGSLDTLEAIGKKTVEVLQEGDPGLKKKRAFLKLEPEKPNLSQILREAKEKAEEENQQQTMTAKKVVNYEALFDDHQGLVHLEALEMLSKVCSIKLDHLNKTLTGDALKEMQETLDQVKELCELPEDEEEDIKLSLTDAENTLGSALKELNIPINYNKLFETWKDTDNWLNNVNTSFIDEVELHQQAIETLAQLTAIAMEQFHKSGELLMVKEHRSTADEADSLVQITTTLKSLILNQANRFVDKFEHIKTTNKENVNEQITNIFYEAANSGTYIQTAFQLLIPVLQVGAI
ncbi:hypothetical protein GWI33_011109 [Rhynchophorus ferrugineus]|uniref:Protein FAM114A2 n=1 Tax=Rhynchophorus ferrugineus TaxID=354439 RepID=A0A834MK41_RHYFE|nr:hypothetical protein GWI33_011109 [Rhynchophorus ferrugineus]